MSVPGKLVEYEITQISLCLHNSWIVSADPIGGDALSIGCEILKEPGNKHLKASAHIYISGSIKCKRDASRPASGELALSEPELGDRFTVLVTDDGRLQPQGFLSRPPPEPEPQPATGDTISSYCHAESITPEAMGAKTKDIPNRGDFIRAYELESSGAYWGDLEGRMFEYENVFVVIWSDGEYISEGVFRK